MEDESAVGGARGAEALVLRGVGDLARDGLHLRPAPLALLGGEGRLAAAHPLLDLGECPGVHALVGGRGADAYPRGASAGDVLVVAATARGGRGATAAASRRAVPDRHGCRASSRASRVASLARAPASPTSRGGVARVVLDEALGVALPKRALARGAIRRLAPPPLALHLRQARAVPGVAIRRGGRRELRLDPRTLLALGHRGASRARRRARGCGGVSRRRDRANVPSRLAKRTGFRRGRRPPIRSEPRSDRGPISSTRAGRTSSPRTAPQVPPPQHGDPFPRAPRRRRSCSTGDALSRTLASPVPQRRPRAAHALPRRAVHATGRLTDRSRTPRRDERLHPRREAFRGRHGRAPPDRAPRAPRPRAPARPRRRRHARRRGTKRAVPTRSDPILASPLPPPPRSPP